MKRIVAVLLLIGMSAGVFGCSSGKDIAVKTPLVESGAIVAIPTLSVTFTPVPTPAPTPTPTVEPTPTAQPTPAPTSTPKPTEVPVEELNYIPGYVNADGVNVRKKPSTLSEVLCICKQGKQLLITGRAADWYRVEVGDTDGFIARKFITVGYLVTPTPKPPSCYTVYPGQFSDADVRLVAQLITKEGPGSTKVGLRAIASVVLNRVLNKSGKFPNTVHGVIFQGRQFGYEEEYLTSVTPTNLALSAARYVLQEHGATLPKKVLFYKAAYLGIPWTYYTEYYTTIEGNNYYYGRIYY